jgi:hypothetical protein
MSTNITHLLLFADMVPEETSKYECSDFTPLTRSGLCCNSSLLVNELKDALPFAAGQALTVGSHSILIFARCCSSTKRIGMMKKHNCPGEMGIFLNQEQDLGMKFK